MSRPLCSVVMATYERGELLRRSIDGYNRSNFPLDRLEVVVVDDGSTDQTRHVVHGLDKRIDLKYIRLRKPEGLWRDCAAVINVGIRAAQGEHIVLTHPEVMPGRDSLAYCCEGRDDEYSSCKPYYLLPCHQERIDTVPWEREGPLAVRRFPDFYDRSLYPSGDLEGFTPWAVEAATVWRCWVFGSFTRAGMKRLGGMIETRRWGSVDITLMTRRTALAFAERTGQADSTYVLHQFHGLPGEVPTPRIAEGPGGWCEEVAALGPLTPETAGFPHVDHLW